jgi:hypothetical protein
MAWIESHQTLVHHPKLLKLKNITGWTSNECIGVMHRLWWWTLAYAESGYLGDHEPEAISSAIEAQENNHYSHGMLFEALKSSKFVTTNYFIHDWLDYAGRYLKTKYRTSNPDKLADIIDNYNKKKVNRKSKRGQTKVDAKSDTLTNLPLPTNKTKELLSEALRLADLLAEKMLENNPNVRELQTDKRERTLRAYAEDIDKAIRLDKRSAVDLEAVLLWSQADSFWKVNIRSGAKLRKQFDQLYEKMNPIDVEGFNPDNWR